MSLEFTGDPYAAQLRAARAEGELARIKDELRYFAEENGFNPEMEPRDLLAKAAGAFRSCAAMSDARYAEIQELRAEMEAMRPRLMPEGIEWLLEVWPKWSNGEYCKFGDWWVSDNYGEPKPKQFRKLSIYTPEQLDEWGQGDGESYGYEWDFLRPSDPKYRPDKVELPAPKALGADRVEIREGDTVYEVEGTGHAYKVVGIRVGDGDPLTPTVVTCDVGDGTSEHFLPSQLTHQRPEVDSWSRLEEDAKLSLCEYNLRHKPAAGDGTTLGEDVRVDLVRRCRALAERERGE